MNNYNRRQIKCCRDSFDVIPLDDYQKYAHDFVMSRPYNGLFFDMGLGKTRIMLSVIYDLNPHYHVLIVAPKNIARNTWLDEINDLHLPLRVCSLLNDENGKLLSRKKRLELYQKVPFMKPTIYLINRDLIADLVQSLNPWPFKMVILDESQSFKNPTSARFKALREVRPQISRLTLLSGTPAPNGIEDLWSQIYLLDEGKRLETSFSRFRNLYMSPSGHINGRPISWKPKLNSENVIYRKISSLVISKKNEVLRSLLPSVHRTILPVRMNQDEMHAYEQMKLNYVFPLLNDDQITAANAAVLSGKLRQMASGTLYREDGSYLIIHERKLDAAEYIIENADSPVMIAYHFQADLDMLQKRFPQASAFDGSPEMMAAWNKRKIPVLLVQPASAGHGLNLQYGGHILIWYTLPWSLEEYEQCNARFYRRGQTDPVIIHHLMCDHTIDYDVYDALHNKLLSQKALIQAVLMQVLPVSPVQIDSVQFSHSVSGTL